MTSVLDTEAVRAAVAGTPWRPVRVVASTGSTNADLAAEARAGTAAGAVLISAHQSAGRGRLARRWEAPPGTSWATSVLVSPQRPLDEWGWLPLLVGIAVARGVADVTGLEPSLKWPNDVLLGEGKLCGILCEMVAESAPPAAVLGFGLNTSLTTEQLPVPTATSLSLAGVDADPAAVLSAVLGQLAALLSGWERGVDLRPGYRQLCATLGRAVTVHLPTGPVSGTAVDVNAEGGLVVDTASGRRTFLAGDVEHLRPE